MLLTHTLGRTTPPHTLTRPVTHMLKQLTYVIIAQTRKFSPAAQLSRAQRSPVAATATERQSSSNCSQMYAMFFSIFLAALTLRSAATLRRVAAPQWTLVLKIFMLPAVEAELVGQHRILATVATAPACLCLCLYLCHCPSCVYLCLCLCPCHCPWHWHCHCCCCLFCSSLTFDVTVSPA